jgi:uncharacterized Zn finger protein
MSKLLPMTTWPKCPKCSRPLRELQQIKKTDFCLYQCNGCATVYRLAVDKRQTHTTDVREAKPL